LIIQNNTNTKSYFPKTITFIITEFTWIKVDVPATYSQQLRNRQYDGFIDVVQPVLKKNNLG
jgi:hypothetical protein